MLLAHMAISQAGLKALPPKAVKVSSLPIEGMPAGN
jgi:hypothetical protein